MIAAMQQQSALLRRVHDELVDELRRLGGLDRADWLRERPAVAELLDVLDGADQDPLVVVPPPGGPTDDQMAALAQALGDDVVITRVPAPLPPGPAVWRTPWGSVEAVEPPPAGYVGDGQVLVEQHLRIVPLTASAAREFALALFAAAQHLEIVAVERTDG